MRNCLRTLAPLVLSSSLLTLPAIAEQGFYETEPNDTPENFPEISGEISLYGSMVGPDQDGYLWTVSDNDARKRWSFELHGDPGALTITDIVRLTYADNGVEVTSKKSLLKMGTRDGVTPATRKDLMFEPGEYVIGLAQMGAGKKPDAGGVFRPPTMSLSFGTEETDEPTGAEGNPGKVDESAGAYRFLITEGAPVYPAKNPGKRATREQAQKLKTLKVFSTFETEETVWYSLAFDETQAQQRWDIKMQVPVGRSLSAELQDESGNKLLTGKTGSDGKLRFPDLAPSPGTLYIKLMTQNPGFIHSIGTVAVGKRVEGEEAEPNTKYTAANRIDLVQPVTGRIGGDDSADYFWFTPGEQHADELVALRVESEPPVTLTICLHNENWANVQCRDGTTPLELPDLMLGDREWGISISRAGETAYTMSLQSQEPVSAAREMEPNESIDYANGVPKNFRIKGRFTGSRDKDFYRITVAEEPQLWRFQVIGDNVFELGYYDGQKRQRSKLRNSGGQRRLRLENIFLMPGRHYIRVQGNGEGDYTLIARRLGPPDPDSEIEPNDKHNKQRLAVGQTRVGVSSHAGDADHYRFFVANWDHLRLSINPPEDGKIAPNIYWYDGIIGQGMPAEAGKPMVMQGLFPPGDYHVALEPREVSDAEYTIGLERLPRWSCPSDCEPGGQGPLYLASPLPRDLVLTGVTGEWRDWDYYQLPAFETDTDIILRSLAPVKHAAVGTRFRQRQRLIFDKELGGYRATVTAGEPHRLMIDSRGVPYNIRLEFPGGELMPVTTPLAAGLTLTLQEKQVSAYRLQGQQVYGELRVRNSGTEPLDASLEVTTSDLRWQSLLAQNTVSLQPGESKAIPMEVLVPNDAWADVPVRISIRAMDVSGAQVETYAEIAVRRDILPVNPRLHWPLPEQLRGGININWLPFGAEWLSDAPKPARAEGLRDNLNFPTARVECCSSGSGWEKGQEPAWTIKLPGDEPLLVAGTAINHFGTPGPFHDIRKATLLTSLDGVNFVEALSFEALSVQTDQYFALDSPRPARFVRLRIENTFEEPSTGRIFASEWKVVLQPGTDLSNGEGFNIADPELGGHLVWAWPPEGYAPNRVITPDDHSKSAHMRRELQKDYIIGFNQSRAAQITRVDWEYADNAREETKVFRRIEAAASLDSPIGPWLPLGDLTIDPDDKSAALELDSPAWARYVRIRAHKNPGDRGAQAPGQIRVFERAAGKDYQTVLGEWGSLGPRAFYELTKGLQPEAELVEAGHTSRARAAPLTTAKPVRGQVSLGKQTHWYKLQVSPEHNTLSLAMAGDPTVRTIADLENTAGEEIPLRRVDAGEIPGEQRFEAIVEPGSKVFFHVTEPPRNVVFTWDTSASVGPYIPQINNSLVAFSSQVVPGQEAVNLMPFSNTPLLKEWLGEPYMLQTMLNDFRRVGSSSSAERTMKQATALLAPRAGTKAMMVITDAQTPHDGYMWGEMQRAKPRIFTVGVSGADRSDQHRLRDWSMVNGGYFTQLRYDGEMEVAFDRAATLMHRPAGYRMRVDSEFREAPGPGTLLVKASKGSATGPAVELILDASGSMLKRMNGKRRIAIARKVLTEAVMNHIPPGTPVALRVFGHKEVDSCRTDLEIPLKPLDPAAAGKKINSINAMNLARTPIAASLSAVEMDLKGAEGGAIILVTDGEETCDGDPEAVITALQEKGFDVSLNIVGFGIDNMELTQQFQAWASLGGGRYFAANDQAGLSDALQDALKVPFMVYDSGGNVKGQGEVGGEPLELEQGFYRVVVKSQPAQVFEKVEILGEMPATLTLK